MVLEGSGTSRWSGQYDIKNCIRDCLQHGACFVQQALPNGEGIWHVETQHKSVTAGHLGPVQFQDEECSFSFGFHQKRRPIVLRRFKWCIFPDTTSSGIEVISLVLSEWDSLPVQNSLLWSFNSTPGLHHPVCAGLSMGHQQVICLLCYRDDWLVLADSLLIHSTVGSLSFVYTWALSSFGKSQTMTQNICVST